MRKFLSSGALVVALVLATAASAEQTMTLSGKNMFPITPKSQRAVEEAGGFCMTKFGSHDNGGNQYISTGKEGLFKACVVKRLANAGFPHVRIELGTTGP